MKPRRLLPWFLFPAVCSATAFAVNPVTLSETPAEYILANGRVTARVAKASGDLVSLRYRDQEMLATMLKEDGTPDLERDPPGFNHHGLNPRMTDHQYGFWSHDAMGPPGTAPAIATVTIDPAQNGGDRAEVSVKGIAEGRRMGTGPGAGAEGDFAADVEIRYSLGRDDSGIYTYSIFEHKPAYPAASITEARFCAKLNDFFDWMSLSNERNLYYPKELHTGDKYIFTSVQWENPALGWSSTAGKVGFFLLNPTTEYLSGGPTKVEFLGHRDTNAVGAPCVLNYWRSSHYGGAEVVVAGGEHWAKVIGPFLLYVNTGKTVATLEDLRPDRVITRHGLQGIWYERTVKFDARRLRSGENTLTLTVPAGRVNDGLVYDYLRLELDDAGASRPTLFIAGDSTAADGNPGAIGWGSVFGAFFDPARVNVVNRAVGGTGARTFRRGENYQDVLAMLRPGDVVIMQFGHNDNGPRGPLPGIGEETEERPGQESEEGETVYTFGGYLRQYIAEIRARGAVPIVCSLVPRNIWKDGRIARSPNRHADWARQTAEAENVAFIDLHERIAQRYETHGAPAVEPLFADKGVHTSWAGAILSAACVIEGLNELPDNPVSRYYVR